MKKFLAVLLAGLMISPFSALAADNAITVTNGTDVLLRTVDTGMGQGQAVAHVVVNNTGVNIVGAGTTMPVSGTLTAVTTVSTVTAVTSITNPVAVTQSGTWNITNVSGTISLPTGASTAAKQPALGTAGTASSDVITVQGIASMTPLLANPGTAANWGVVTQGSTTSGQSGQMAMGAVTTSSPTYTTAQTSPLSLDTAGSLRVAIISGAGSGGTAITDNAAFTTGTTSETPAACYAGSLTATANHSTVMTCTTAGSLHTTVDNTNTNIGNNADAVAVTASPFTACCSPVNSYGYVFNGTTWDRAPGSTTGAQVKVASGGIASGAIASGAFAAGSFTSATAADACMFAAKTTVPISTSSAGPVSLVALSGSTKVYICSISVITDTAIKLNFIDGTGGSCASAQHAIWGSTTAANGMSLAANGGFTMGNGQGTVGVTAAASAFCLLQSGTSLVAGNLTYVQL